MEKYVNEETIIKDNKYELLKEYIECKRCGLILIKPVICFECQNIFCKKCIEECNNQGTCPMKCKNPILKDVNENKNQIKNLRFRCIKGCGEAIPFNNIINHYSSNCLSKKKKIKCLNKDEVSKYVKDNLVQIERLTSK